MAKHTLFAYAKRVRPGDAQRAEMKMLQTQPARAPEFRKRNAIFIIHFLHNAKAKQKGMPMWYVVQVRTGTEEEIQKQCEKLIGPEALERSFIPYCEQMKRYHGAWHKETKILFPGYLFLVSPDKEKLFFQLKKVMGLTKLIGTGEEVVPLTEEEMHFLLTFGKDDQIVEMSEGIIENDQIVITRGPLKGHEGLIKKINRHKRRAYLELEMFGRKIETQVGLEVVAKR